MDASVRAALAKWPNVPDCYNWLALDLRGHWRLGQERQSITNPTMNAFIGRNYTHDAEGRWLFQNGPQRVFVSLDYTPWVWQLVPAGEHFALSNHVGTVVAAPDAVWLDELGRFLVNAQGMLGVVHDHDTEALVDLLVDQAGNPLKEDQLMDAIENTEHDGEPALFFNWNASTRIALGTIKSEQVAPRFGFLAQPVEPSAKQRPVA